MNGVMHKIDTKQMSQWLLESTSTCESPLDRLKVYINDFETIPQEQKQEYVKEMVNWLIEAKYLPYDLDVATSIELISILVRNAGDDVDALMIILMIAHQNFIVAGHVDRGFIANEMLNYLLLHGDLIMKFCNEIQEIMTDDPMYDLYSESSDEDEDEEEQPILLYPNLVGAFTPAFHWFKEQYPQVCYNIPEGFISQITSYCDTKKSFEMYSKLCRCLNSAFPEINSSEM